MADFQMTCKYCEGKIVVDDFYLNMEGPCPHCGKILLIVRDSEPKLEEPVTAPEVKTEEPVTVPEAKSEEPEAVSEVKSEEPEEKSEEPEAKSEEPVTVPEVKSEEPVTVPEVKAEEPVTVPEVKAEEPVTVPEVKSEEPVTAPEAKSEEAEAKSEEAEAKSEEAEAKSEEAEAKSEEAVTVPEAKSEEPEAKSEEPVTVSEVKSEEPVTAPEVKTEEPEAKSEEAEAKSEEAEAKSEEAVTVPEAKSEEPEAKSEDAEAKSEEPVTVPEVKSEEPVTVPEAKSEEAEVKSEEAVTAPEEKSEEPVTAPEEKSEEAEAKSEEPVTAPEEKVEQMQNNEGIASLTLGVWGLVLFLLIPISFILSLIGLIIGCKKKRTAGIVLCSIALGVNILIVGLGTVAAIPMIKEEIEKKHLSDCESNMKQIGIALLSYSADKDCFPPAAGKDGLDLLRSTGELTDSFAYKCPSTGESYIYLGEGFKIYETMMVPVVIEMPKNHENVVSVLYGSGSCQQIFLDGNEINNLTDLVKFLSKDLPKRDQERLLKNAERYSK